MRVDVSVDEIEMEGDYSNTVDGVEVTCNRCGHCVEVFGTSSKSILRGCIMLRDECPQGEKNFYFQPSEAITRRV